MRAVRVFVVAFVVGGAAAAGVLAAIIPARFAPINVRWRPEVTPPQRAALEQRFHLAQGDQAEGTTWSYLLTDASFINIRALVRDPSVDDTAHINRRFFRPEFGFDREARILIGGIVSGAVLGLVMVARGRVRGIAALTQLTEPTILASVAAAPALVLASCVVLLLDAAIGGQPLWANRPVSLAEAARAGDTATVFRMVNAGADPNATEPVSVEQRALAVALTPLEAAVESRQVEVVQVLMRLGARASEAERGRLTCLAAAVDAPEVKAYLEATVSPGAVDCSDVSLPPH